VSDGKTARPSAGDSERAHGSIGSHLRPVDRPYDGYVFDLDGTVYLGDALLPRARETIEHLRGAGRRLVFLTNKPLERSSNYAAKMTRLGLPTTPAEIVSSTDALLRYLGEKAAGARIFPVAEPLLWELLAEAGFETTDRPEPSTTQS
jgi:NagD protein